MGAVQRLFLTRAVGSTQGYMYDVSRDGQRFWVNTLAEDVNPSPLTLIVNWTTALRK